MRIFLILSSALGQIMKKRFLDNGYLVFLCMLILTDLVFVGLHLVHTHTSYLANGTYSIEQDRGHAEFFQYTKEFWIIILMLVVFIKEATLTNMSWLMVFVYVLFDDAISIHENIGHLASNLFAFAAELGLRAQDWGELLVTALAGVVLLTPVVIAYLRASARERMHSLTMALLLGVLAFFGIGVDMLHSLFGGDSWGMLEDTGEMFAVSVILFYMFRYSFERGALPVSSNIASAGYASAVPDMAGGVEPAMASVRQSI